MLFLLLLVHSHLFECLLLLGPPRQLQRARKHALTKLTGSSPPPAPEPPQAAEEAAAGGPAVDVWAVAAQAKGPDATLCRAIRHMLDQVGWGDGLAQVAPCCIMPCCTVLHHDSCAWH